MKFSIIVPVYKVERFLERCLNSLINQTCDDIEIILVDDGSPDKSPQICDKFSEIDSRIHVIHKANGGLSDARNAGLKIAKGEYVLFVDSDDYIELTACENFVSYLSINPDIVLGKCVTENTGYSTKYAKCIEVNKIYQGEEYIKAALTNHKFPVMVWLNLYRRQFLLDNNLWFKKGILHEDIEFTPRALLAAEKIIYSKNSFYHYIIHDNSIMTQKDKRKNCRDIYDTCISMEKIICQLKDIELQKYLKEYFCNCYLGIFRAGDLYRYGNEFVHKKYVKNNAYCIKTKMKALIFCVSPYLFCKI